MFQKRPGNGPFECPAQVILMQCYYTNTPFKMLTSDRTFVVYKASPTQFLVSVYLAKLPFKQHLEANTQETELFHPYFCSTHLSWEWKIKTFILPTIY